MADGGFDGDGAAEGVDGVFDDGQAQAGATAGAAAAGDVHLVETLETRSRCSAAMPMPVSATLRMI